MGILNNKRSKNTTEGWAATNPILEDGEIALDTSLNRYKRGNGTGRWNDLSFLVIDTPSGVSPTYTAGRLRLNTDYTVIVRGYEEVADPAALEVLNNFDLETTTPLQAELTPPAELWLIDGDSTVFEVDLDSFAITILRPGQLVVTFVIQAEPSDGNLGEENADGFVNIFVTVERSKVDSSFVPLVRGQTIYNKPSVQGTGTLAIVSATTWIGAEHFYTDDEEDFAVKPQILFGATRQGGSVGYYSFSTAELYIELYEYS